MGKDRIWTALSNGVQANSQKQTNRKKKEKKRKGKENKEEAWLVTGADFHSVDVHTMASDDQSPQCFTADPLSRIYATHH